VGIDNLVRALYSWW